MVSSPNLKPLPAVPVSTKEPIALHLSDGNGNPLRCANVIPLDASTSENAVVCGLPSSEYCRFCGPCCPDCFKDSQCFDSPDGKHALVSVVVRTCTDVLTALLAHKITPAYGLILLRSLGASAAMIRSVEAIEVEAAAEFVAARRGDVLSFVLNSPLWTRANIEAAAELERRRKPVQSVRPLAYENET